MYDEDLSTLMARSAARIVAEMNSAAPSMGAIVGRWIGDLASGGRPEDYFKYAQAYPIFLLPWWLEQSLAATPDEDFMADVVYSTMNGYYHIRLLDNLMDGHDTSEMEILPATAFFHAQFQSAYHAYFPATHPFWDAFRQQWFECAEAVILDRRLRTVDRSQFMRVSARKLHAALIPIAAVCHRYDRPELLRSWIPYCDLLACCVQMTDDVFDWQLDRRQGAATYFLSEAQRMKGPEESVATWVLREGFAWGVSTVAGWLHELRTVAEALDCPPAVTYVDRRRDLLREREQVLAETHAALARIAGTLE